MFKFKGIVATSFVLIILFGISGLVYAATPRFDMHKAFGPFEYYYAGVPGDVFVEEIRFRNLDPTRSITLKLRSLMEGKGGWLAIQGSDEITIPPNSVAGRSYAIQIPDDDPIDPCERVYENIIFMDLVTYDGANIQGTAVNTSVGERVFIEVNSGIPCTPGYQTPGLNPKGSGGGRFKTILEVFDPSAPPPGGGGGSYYSPIVVADTLTVNEDGSGTVDVLANDVDPDGVLLPGSVTIITDPLHGNVTVDSVTGEITYTPDPDFFGGDFFEYQVSDNDGFTGQAGVTVTIQDAGQPVIVDDIVDTEEEQIIEIDVLANDVDPDGMLLPGSVEVISGPDHGTITGIDPVTGEITYTPEPGFVGTDTFTYRVSDDSGNSGTGTVTISVEEGTGQPQIVDDIVDTDEDEAVEVDVLANDIDPDGSLLPATVEVISGPTHGTITGINLVTGVITYRPDVDFVGTDTFTYRVFDDSGNAGTGTVSVTMNEVEELIERGEDPVILDDGYAMDQDGTVTIDPLANDYDPDGFLLPSSLVIIQAPEHGTITNINSVNGVITYVPDPGYFGQDTIVYRVYDDSGLYGDGTVTIEVFEEPPEPAYISVVAYPEKRVPAVGNWTTRGVLSVYRVGETTRDAVYVVTTNDQGEAEIDSELSSGTYTFGFKGLSHLTKFMRNVEVEGGEDIELDFTFGDSFDLLAGDVSGGKDDYVGSLDIAATVIQLYQNNEHADLNRDFTVNSLDLGIEFYNLYKFGETI